MLRHITKADVEGSAALALVASGVVFGGSFMIAALPSELAPSPEGAASAVAALGFFFVILQELKNNQCIYIHMPWFMVLNISTGSCTEVGNSRCRSRRCVQGYEWGWCSEIIDELRVPKIYTIE